MSISIVTLIMMLSLVVTYILLNIFENKKMKRSDRRIERDRRHFNDTYHFPERRSGIDRRFSYNG